MIKVALQGIKYFAYHGYYPEEQVLGSHFVIDVEVEFLQQRDFNDEIAHTVNYEVLYGIVETEMQQTRRLLETVVEAINKKIIHTFPFAETVCTSIKKLNPPLPGQVTNSYIQIRYINPHEL